MSRGDCVRRINGGILKPRMWFNPLAFFGCFTIVAAASMSLALPLDDQKKCQSLLECLGRCKSRLQTLKALHSGCIQQSKEISAGIKQLRVHSSPKIDNMCMVDGENQESEKSLITPRLRGGGGEHLSPDAANKTLHAYDYDYFVIGGGSGGVRSARIAASHGAKVALAESASGGDTSEGGFGGLGGTCVNVGCVPKKLMVYGAHYSQDFQDAQAFGWNLTVNGLDWQRFIQNKNKEIARLNGIYGNMLKNAGVTVIRGRATFIDAHTVHVNGANITADKILIAVGGWPAKPDIPGADLGITSNEAFFLPSLPRRVVIVGGGYIAVEFAEILHGYGSNVTLLYRGDLWLRGFDRDVREHLAAEYRTKGIDVRFRTNVAALQPIPASDSGSDTSGGSSGGSSSSSGVRAILEGAGAGGDGGDSPPHIDADVVLFATGRRPRTAGLGCERAGVKLDAAGAVIVDDAFQTTSPSVYAVGDVIDRVALTPVALAEGHCLADTLFGRRPRKTDYTDIPTAVFSSPPIGTVGLTEEAARAAAAAAAAAATGTPSEAGSGAAAGGQAAAAAAAADAVHVYRTTFRGMRHTLTGRGERTLMKLVVDGPSGRVLGVHMVGPDAGEVIQLAGVCLKAGATKAHFDATIGVHPTAAEEFVTMRTRVPDPPPAAAAAAPGGK